VPAVAEAESKPHNAALRGAEGVPLESTVMRLEETIYTVHAYRWGDRECHSYTVGVFGKKNAALKAAETEEDYRGGKYECEVLEWALDSSIAGNHDNAAKVIKALPPINTLKAHNG